MPGPVGTIVRPVSGPIRAPGATVARPTPATSIGRYVFSGGVGPLVVDVTGELFIRRPWAMACGNSGNTANYTTTETIDPLPNCRLVAVARAGRANHTAAYSWSFTDSAGLGSWTVDFASPEVPSGGLFARGVAIAHVDVGASPPTDVTVTVDAWSTADVGAYGIAVFCVTDYDAGAWLAQTPGTDFVGAAGSTTTTPALASASTGATYVVAFAEDNVGHTVWDDPEAGWELLTHSVSGYYTAHVAWDPNGDASGSTLVGFRGDDNNTATGVIFEVAPASGGTNAPAELAAATGTASGASTALLVNALLATTTGAALAPAVSIRANAGVATATAAASGAATIIGATAGTGTATGTSGGPSPALLVGGGLATATGTANDATTSTATTTNAPAGLATTTGTATGPAVAITATAGAATATGTASAGSGSIGAGAGTGTGSGTASGPATAIRPNAGLASGTGAGNQAAASVGAGAASATAVATAPAPSTAIRVGAGVATATGAGVDATVSTSGNANAPAGLATAAAAATGAAIALAVNPGLSGATGAAPSPAASIRGAAGVATGSGTANNAGAVTAIFATAGLATATATALAGSVAIRPTAGAATAIGTAWSPTALVAQAGQAFAGVARATGTAYNIAARGRANQGTVSVLLTPQTLTKVRPSTSTDTYGNVIYSYGAGATRSTFIGWLQQDNRAESYPGGRDPMVQLWLLVTNDPDLDAADRIEWYGHPIAPVTFAVEGPPEHTYRGLGGGQQHHVEATLRVVEG